MKEKSDNIYDALYLNALQQKKVCGTNLHVFEECFG